MLLCHLDVRSFDDPYPRGFWSRWTFLSEQASPQNRHRHYQKHSVHVHTSKKYSTDRRIETKSRDRFTMGDDCLRPVDSYSESYQTAQPEKPCIRSGIPAVARFVLRYRLRAGYRPIAHHTRCAVPQTRRLDI